MSITVNETSRLLLSQSEAADALGVSLRTIGNLISQGSLQTVKIGRRVLVPRRYLESLAEPGIALETGNTFDGTPLR